jgi:hypothetical protein
MNPRRTLSVHRARLCAAALALLVLALTSGLSTNEARAQGTSVPTRSSAPRAGKPPVLAYYYIWFDARAWARAKKDYPLLGRYSSSDSNVMRQHIRWAKAAGVQGFIVSWRHTSALDPRLAELVRVAAEERFKLVVIYQGLDFQRERRSVETVRGDLEWFADHYSNNEVFRILRRPTLIMNGTESYGREDLKQVIAPVRDRLDVLATEKSVKGYQRIRDLVNGNAYYWSSVNPETYRGYDVRLSELGQEVHRDNGLWIAPAAPGFDSRLLGKPSVVGRRNGATLRRELTAAFNSEPDAVGLISWNEFSENTYVEPSTNYGTRALDVVSQMLGGKPTVVPSRVGPAPIDRILDDSAASGGDPSWGGLKAAGVFAALMLAVSAMLVRSHRRRRRDNGPRAGAVHS